MTYRLRQLLLIGLLLLWVPDLRAWQDTTTLRESPNLQVGVFSFPPFIMQDDRGNWDGLSVQLWRELADDLNLQYEFVTIGGGDRLAALQSGQVDLLLVAEATAGAEETADLSHIYFTDQLGVAYQGSGNLGQVINALISPKFWGIVASLSVLLLVVGTIVYFIERNSNEDNFGGERSVWEGIGSGFWWAGVTMTTIGYGDKAPVTFAGRAVALLWMLVAMLVTASLTAALVSASGSREEVTLPDDLQAKTVIAVSESPATAFLQEQQIGYRTVPSVAQGLQSVDDEEADMLIHSAAALRYAIRTNADLKLPTETNGLRWQPYTMAFPEDSPLLERFNRRLLYILNSPQWLDWRKRYTGE